MAFSQSVTDQLSQPLDPSRVKTRVGGGNTRLSYLEGYDVIDRLNAIYGYDGWHGVATLPVQVAAGVYQAGYTITVGDVTRSDVGHGLVNGDRQEAHEMAGKGAVTDAMKRAARTFGDQFGNSLYDKDSPLHANGNTNGRAAPVAVQFRGGQYSPTEMRVGEDKPAIPGSAPSFSARNGVRTVSPAQVRLIGQLGGTDADALTRFGVATIAEIPMGQASPWIAELKGGQGNAAPQRSAPARQVDPTDDVPF